VGFFPYNYHFRKPGIASTNTQQLMVYL